MMKKITLILISYFFFCFTTFGQIIKFTATDKANINFYEKFDVETAYKPLNTPLKVSFDGKNLNLIYESGKIYGAWIIENYIKIPADSKEIYILTYKHKDIKLNSDFYMYITITKTLLWGEYSYNIKIPMMTNGIIGSYISFEKF